MGYSAGYGMALISYVQFYYVCEFGEDIEVRHSYYLIIVQHLYKLYRIMVSLKCSTIPTGIYCR